MYTVGVNLLKVICKYMYHGSNLEPLYLELSALPLRYTHPKAFQRVGGVVTYDLASQKLTAPEPLVRGDLLSISNSYLQPYHGILWWTTLRQLCCLTQISFHIHYISRGKGGSGAQVTSHVLQLLNN